jgi:nicotinate-nucleotide pyrophosphorylase (carboxylating)
MRAFPFSRRTRQFIRAALREDLGPGDITSSAVVPPNTLGSARVVAKAAGRLCGIPVFEEVFRLVDRKVVIEWRTRDGESLEKDTSIAELSGPIASMLIAERTALNFLQRLSGIATLTSSFVTAASSSKAKIIDTRKTTPLWRELEKYAVRVGGGANHRFGLFDMFLIKDNHIAAAGGISRAIEATTEFRAERHLHCAIEVEARTVEEVKEALQFPIQRIMLDNMSLSEIETAVALIAGRCEVEVSGGVNLDNVRSIAASGVEYVSVGALTHSAPALDLSMLVIRR